MKWQDVNDVPPPKYQNILVYGYSYADKNNKQYFIKISQRDADYESRMNFNVNRKLTHLMYLPEPPKE